MFGKKILVTGATGYIGGRLVPELLARGYQVRAFTRSREKLQGRPWARHPQVELFSGDVFDLKQLSEACRGCGAAYYLVHSMLPGQKDFQKADQTAAENMRAAAEENHLERILYLGGLGEDGPGLSKHLKSRAEVGKILSQGKVPVTALRAAMVIGSGSASFEILRYLVERLPVMVTPKWLETPNQPIAIRNVIEYLIGCLEVPETAGKSFDIGGADVLTYRELMKVYAEEAGLSKRIVFPVPVLTPRLSSYWIHLVTPVPASIARPLAEGLKNPVVCKNNEIRALIPQEVLSAREAIRRALANLRGNEIKSHWTDAGRMPPLEFIYPGDPQWAGGTRYQDDRSIEVPVPAERLWRVIEKIGGRQGWYHADWLWSFRGFLDRLAGGVGLRRGRRDENKILPGDSLDFWRAAEVTENKRLLLYAEMKLPGRATLEFNVDAVTPNQSRLRMSAKFYPKGLMGILYWYLVLPFHHYIFNGMMRQIAARARL